MRHPTAHHPLESITLESCLSRDSGDNNTSTESPYKADVDSAGKGPQITEAKIERPQDEEL